MLTSLEPMTVSVNYDPLCAAQLGLPGDPAWEAATVPDQGMAELRARLSISNSSRQDMWTTYEWLKRTGARPSIFRETVAIRQAMDSIGQGGKLVCAGSLWWIEGCYYYVCWHDGQVHLYPFERPFGLDFVCPIVLAARSADLPPGTGVSLTTV